MAIGTVKIIDAKQTDAARKRRIAKAEPIVFVRKSNSLIQSIGKTTLLSNKVFLTSLLKIEDRTGMRPGEETYYKRLETASGTDFSTGLVAEFSSAEMRKMMGTKSGSFYQSIAELLDPTSKSSLRNQWVILVKDQKDGLYGVTDVITSTLYDAKNGRMYIKFSSEKKIREALIDYKNNFTTLNYNLMMRFKSVYTYRLYELLMSRIGYDDGVSKKKKDEYCYRYGFSELKYLLGILDPYVNKDVKSALQGPYPDYDKIEHMMSDEKSMMRYNDFQRYTLAKAKDEIDNARESEFYFDYEPVRGGKGGKVIGVNLIATRKNRLHVVEQVEEKKVNRDDALDEICDMIFTAIGKPLKIKDCRAIADAADYDVEKIRRAIAFMASSGSIIENVTGYLISAIRNGYSAPVDYMPIAAVPGQGWDDHQ